MDEEPFRVVSRVKAFGGTLTRFVSQSPATQCAMTCSIYVPCADGKVPLIVYLSGLTCTDENAAQKGNCFGSLREHKCAMVFPDTSPRGPNGGSLVEGDSASWDFGIGAGFYVDATAAPWSNHFNMYSYITKDLPAVLEANFGDCIDTKRVSIMGHSMGGHGALTIALKNQATYVSVSAFAPICNPINCPWGKKAFSNYLSEGNWEEYDATALISKLGRTRFDDILIDVGTADAFYAQKQLLPEAFAAACQSVGQPLRCRMEEGYDHGYYFVSTFMDDHIQHHAARLHV